jgi:hypothetical protein
MVLREGIVHKYDVIRVCVRYCGLYVIDCVRYCGLYVIDCVRYCGLYVIELCQLFAADRCADLFEPTPL